MMNKVLRLALPVLVFACGGTKATKPGLEDSNPQDVARAGVLDESFDPSTLREPPIPILPKNRETGAVEQGAATSEELKVEGEQEMTGYRIQILQTEFAEEAREIQKEALLLDQEIYLTFDNPYYKVRLGDFQRRSDAEEFLENVLDKGFRNAWIVRTKIKLQAEPDKGSE